MWSEFVCLMVDQWSVLGNKVPALVVLTEDEEILN